MCEEREGVLSGARSSPVSHWVSSRLVGPILGGLWQIPGNKRRQMGGMVTLCPPGDQARALKLQGGRGVGGGDYFLARKVLRKIHPHPPLFPGDHRAVSHPCPCPLP